MAAAEAVVEEIALNLEEAAEVTRRLDTKALGFFFGGLAVGAAVGFYFGHRWNTAKIKAEAFTQSEAEVDKIRELYRQRMVAAEPKPSVEEVIEEKGYSDFLKEERTAVERPLKPPVPVREPPLTREDIRKSKDEGWDFPAELAQRASKTIYIIHQDEFRESVSGYRQAVYTWYDRDNVLTDEDEDPIDNPDMVVGMENMERFGHGADDVRAVFVRNELMESEFEICYVDASYEETLEGLSNEQTD